MISIDWKEEKKDMTCECSNVDEARQLIINLHIPAEGRVKMKINFPISALEDLVTGVTDLGGRIL